MEKINTDEQNISNENWANWEKNRTRGKIAGGLLFVTIGALFLARELGAQFPEWLFTWKTLLIGIGVVSGIKHRFRNFSWIALISVGSAFLLSDFYPEMHIKQFVAPILIIAAGLFMIFKPKRRWRRWDRYNRDRFCNQEGMQSTEDFINCETVFGAIKKNIISKEFKGGDINLVCAGVELDLSHADLADQATLNISIVMGGVKLIIPSNWKVQSEVSITMGDVNDKRRVSPNATEASAKTLLLKGSVVMGGIEIKNYN